jgi:hypothetical protein
MYLSVIIIQADASVEIGRIVTPSFQSRAPSVSRVRVRKPALSASIHLRNCGQFRINAFVRYLNTAGKTDAWRCSRLASTRDLPTIAFFRAARCCDVTDLYQAFSQRA